MVQSGGLGRKTEGVGDVELRKRQEPGGERGIRQHVTVTNC